MGLKATLPAALRQNVSSVSVPTTDRVAVYVTSPTLHTLESKWYRGTAHAHTKKQRRKT
jgi:hypothetical protein